MLIAGGLSIVAGVAYIVASAGIDPEADPLVLYRAAGGIHFVVQAKLVA
jgi:hypothetical protein